MLPKTDLYGFGFRMVYKMARKQKQGCPEIKQPC